MEQKKGFLEDGGGFDRIWDGTVNFFKRLRKTRFAQIVGLVLIFLFMVNSIFGSTVWQINHKIQNIDLRRSLQNELNVAQLAGVSASQLEEINYILGWITIFGSWPDNLFDDYLEMFGEYPFSSQERQLMRECAALCGHLDQAAWDFRTGGDLVLFVGLSLGLWLSCGKGRKIRYPLLALLAGFLVGHMPALLYSAWLAQDATAAVHTICGLFFSNGVWPLPPKSGTLALICTPDVFAGIWKEVMRGLGSRIGSTIKGIGLYILLFGAAVCLSKLIDIIKTKKNKTEERT